MQATIATAAPAKVVRFTTRDLFAYTTVCSILLACHPVIGVTSAALLSAMALALGARAGLMAAFLFAGALATSGSATGVGEFGTLLLGTAVLGWYRYNRWRNDQAAYQKWLVSNMQSPFPRERAEPWLF